MLYGTHIISDVCYIGHTYQTYFCCIEHTHCINLYYTEHVVSDISMLYRTYSCCIWHIYVYRTHIGHIHVVSDALYLIYLLYRTFSYYDGSIFYRTCLCYIGYICVLRDTYYIGHIYVISDTIIGHLCYIGHKFYRTYLFYWTHISDMFMVYPTPLSDIFMCCKDLNKILY